MRKLLIASLLSVVSTQSVMAQHQETISTLRDLRNEARVIIKDFELTDLKIEVGAPEYKAVRELLHANIQKEIVVLDKQLNDISSALSTDYSLIMSLKRQKGDSATKRTIEIATERLTSKANELTAGYHARLKGIILLSSYQVPLLQKCATVLCVEKVSSDFQNWFKKSKNLNRNLDLEVTKMNKVPQMNDLISKEIDGLENNRNDIGKYLPVALSVEQYNEVLRIEEEKKAQELRIQAEKEADRLERERKRQGQMEKIKRRADQPYGCEQVEELKENDIYKCKDPYKLVNGVKNRINDLPADVYANLCAAHGLKTPVIKAAWITGIGSDYERSWSKHMNYYYDYVTCDDSSFDGMSRLSYEKTNLVDGSIVIKNLRVSMGKVTAGISSFGNSSSNINTTAICLLLGYRRASEERGYSDNYYMPVLYAWDNEFSLVNRDHPVDSFKCSL